MFIKAEYEPITAFGLRPSNSTSSGGKSLLIPTPYAVKMALLDRLIRYEGEADGKTTFASIRDLTIYLGLPEYVAVNRSFQKVLRPDGKLWKETIVQREYCFHSGRFELVLATISEHLAERLPSLLSAVNYFGRKGGFMQLVAVHVNSDGTVEEEGYVNLCRPADLKLPLLGILQRMDDMQEDATFEDVSVLSPQKASSNGGRRQYNIALPYEIWHHGFHGTIYRAMETR